MPVQLVGRLMKRNGHRHATRGAAVGRAVTGDISVTARVPFFRNTGIAQFISIVKSDTFS